LEVTGPEYRITFQRYTSDFDFELRDTKGAWRRVAKKTGQPEFGISEGPTLRTTTGNPVRLANVVQDGCIVVGVTTVLSVEPQRLATLHYFCADEGVLTGFALTGPGLAEGTTCWALPRWPLDLSLFDGYAFWREPDDLRTGTIASLGDHDAYAGASAWGGRGDAAKRVSARHPALIAQARGAGTALGVVFLDFAGAWGESRCFVQRHTPEHLFLY
jgi:hypothetical protein